MKNAFSIWLLLIALLPALSAAESKPRTFRVVTVGGSHPEFLYDNGRAKGVQIAGYADSLSLSCAAPSGGTLSLYRMVEPPANAPAGTRPIKEILAEIAYPQDIARAIVVLYPSGADAPLPYSGQVIDDSMEVHQRGMARMLNLSALQVAFAAPDELTLVPPRSLQSIARFTTGSCHVKVAAQDGGWKVVVDMQRKLSANLRLFVLLVDAPSVDGGPPIACTLIYDTLRPPMTFMNQNGASQ